MEDLGKFRDGELIDMHVRLQQEGDSENEYEEVHDGYYVCHCALSKEIQERLDARVKGAPGRHALLSTAQVRAVAPGPSMDSRPGYQMWIDGYNAAREDFARALLNLPSDAPRPLDE